MPNNSAAMAPLDVRACRIRPISAADGDALVRFHEGLTKETTRLRFFIVHPYLMPAEVARFTNVDHQDREAFVAVDGTEIVGVGRFDRLPGSDNAEVAFVVADAWQHHGIGSKLLEQLVVRARAVGITGFIADTLEENHHMRSLLRRSGLTGTSSAQIGVVRVAIDLES